MRLAILAACPALFLAACAPDVSKVAGEYSKAVDGAKTALNDVVIANRNARKALDYQSIALDRKTLGFTAECQQLFDLAAWTGGTLVVSDEPPNEEVRHEDLKSRRAIITRAAKECAVEVGSRVILRVSTESQLPEARLRDPLYLCGIDLSRLGGPDYEKQLYNGDISMPGVKGGSTGRIPPQPLIVGAQAEIMPALAAYAKALKVAAEAKDIEELEAAATKVVDSFTALAALAGPYGAVVGPAVKAVGTAATTLTGVFLHEKRFRFIKEVVIATDSAVRDSAAISCHSAMMLSYEIVRAKMFQTIDALAEYNITGITSPKTFQADRELIAQLNSIDRAVVSAREVASADYISAMLGVSAAHRSLKDALENPKTDFKATIELLEKLIGQLEDVQKATSALANG